METSLRKLRMERVDLMQVHNLVDVAAHLETLRAWKSGGACASSASRTIRPARTKDVAHVIESEADLDFVQINYSVGEREAERRLLPLARGVGWR